MEINNKQDVIKWLKWLIKEQPLTTRECCLVEPLSNRDRYNKEVAVFTDQIIKDRYQGMIDYLKSDEVK